MYLLYHILTLVSTCSTLFPPIPPAPFPGGEGGDQGYFMQGASPLASLGLGGARHGLNLRSRHPAGGVPPGVGGSTSRCGARWGLSRRGNCLPAVSLLFRPHPPQPPSRREGGDQGYFMQGASPLASPGLYGARHRYCLWKTGSFGFKWCVGTRWGGGNPGCKKPPPGVHLYTGSVSAVGGSVQGCRGRSPRQNKLWAPPSRREGGQGDGGKKAS